MGPALPLTKQSDVNKQTNKSLLDLFGSYLVLSSVKNFAVRIICAHICDVPGI